MDGLPKLPEPRTLSRGDEDGAISLGYSADQMRAYALEAVAAYKADAERYRWLRDNDVGDWCIATYDEDWGYSWCNMEPAEIEAAIDETRSAP